MPRGTNALLVGYARVSTESQDLTAQRDALRVLGVGDDRIYVDRGLTGTNRDRPGLQLALTACRAGDTLVVTKLDRLARSLPDARDILAELTAKSVRLSMGGSVHDPSDPVGRLLFNVLAMVAEFESDLIRMRTREGMQVAKAKGRLRGKQPKLTVNPGQASGRAVRSRDLQHRRAGGAVRRRAFHGLPDPAPRSTPAGRSQPTLRHPTVLSFRRRRGRGPAALPSTDAPKRTACCGRMPRPAGWNPGVRVLARALDICSTRVRMPDVARSIGFRPTPDDERILREAARPGESTTETLRRALRLLDHDRWLEQFRADADALKGEDLNAEPEAW